ncbi:hypothetical protein TWF225_005287 [Orbilia oligospora]|uniref:Uncharacterized protein n=1 Tax=Orbilia oligospora TaxID=2813651 RepID=A0A7C8K7R6_ORBOL|nr:hypothetical protein TWF751_001035 [Orbilia oligospora]KAF3185514.1 hypothetical protein TWF225_005287 [Orbilia oligospora]KAF3242035.1 hypothetical protein TWF217_011851 [Orbilia oligospora]KAF3244535.1 hypothetical protein TWF128_009646 [Orbilia oligospora]KAF3294544.1 hypothetical protein TWF132_003047 [Orbilia oligospora]
MSFLLEGIKIDRFADNVLIGEGLQGDSVSSACKGNILSKRNTPLKIPGFMLRLKLPVSCWQAPRRLGASSFATRLVRNTIPSENVLLMIIPLQHATGCMAARFSTRIESKIEPDCFRLFIFLLNMTTCNKAVLKTASSKAQAAASW